MAGKGIGSTVRNAEPFQKPKRQAKTKAKTIPAEAAVSIVMTY